MRRISSLKRKILPLLTSSRVRWMISILSYLLLYQMNALRITRQGRYFFHLLLRKVFPPLSEIQITRFFGNRIPLIFLLHSLLSHIRHTLHFTWFVENIRQTILKRIDISRKANSNPHPPIASLFSGISLTRGASPYPIASKSAPIESPSDIDGCTNAYAC